MNRFDKNNKEFRCLTNWLVDVKGLETINVEDLVEHYREFAAENIVDDKCPRCKAQRHNLFQYLDSGTFKCNVCGYSWMY